MKASPPRLTMQAITACMVSGIGVLLLQAISSATGSATNPRFERDVYPFEVMDESGTPYAHPFLGGLNIPRPQLADIDDDRDLDLFVQEYSDAVMFFEQIGTAEQPRYIWRDDRFQDINIGEWYHFVDVDGDRDLDLLGEQRFSRIRYYRNTGGPKKPAFALATQTLVDDDGDDIFSDRQNIPKVADIDCDGRLDLFVGRLEGTITHYETVGVEDNGAPRFRHQVDRYQGIEIIGQVLGASPTGRRTPTNGRPPGTSLHGANTMALEDIDRDGDLDLFWGDFFEPGLLLIENRGSCQSPSLRSRPVPFPLNDPARTSGYNAPTFGDLDDDGDIDLLLGVLGGAFNPQSTTIANFLHFEQVDQGRFTHRTAQYLTSIDVGSESFPAFADLDGDGDLDLLLGNKIEPHDPASGRLYRFENIGSAVEPALQLRGAMEISGAYHYAPAIGDLDDDDDLDILMGTWDDELALLINEGTATAPRFVVSDPAIVKITRGRNSTPTLGDIDDDGDLDLFIGESSGQLNFYRNDGGPREPRFVLVSDKFDDIDLGRRSVPTLVDLDRDGDLDLVIGSEASHIALYRNTGTPSSPKFVSDESFNLLVQPLPTPTFADIDGDDDDDLFVGSTGGGLIFFENPGD